MKRETLILVAVLLLAADAMAAKTVPDGVVEKEPAAQKLGKKGEKKAELTWRTDLREALTLAGQEYKPVLVLFTSPDCTWCARMKSNVFTDPDVSGLLEDFSLVEIDVTADRATADMYQIKGVPAILILSADGEVKKGVEGYVPVTEMKKLLMAALSPEFLKAKSAAYLELLAMLDDNQVPSNKWVDVLAELGSTERRKEIQPRLLKMSPFPKKEIVEQLKNERLIVRLGAMEIIEELTGKDWGYDPWQAASSAASNEVVMARLQAWAAEKEEESEGSRAVFAALTKEQITIYVQDIVAGDNERSVRAMRMLENGGANVAESLVTFLEEHKDLNTAARKRIKEVQYIMALKGAGNLDASSVARKLLYGKLDMRIETITGLHVAGLRAVPVLKEFLDDPDPIVREAAVDTLVSAGAARAVPILRKHLKVEKDKDVVYSILKNLGKVRSSAGTDILTSYLLDPNEDLVVAALGSIAKLKSVKVSGEISKCLADPRWRVRVAALDALAQLKLGTLAGKVEELLGDKDPFVRYSAVKALTAVSAKNARKKLEEIFLKEDDLKPPVISAFCSMDLAIPDTFDKALEGKGDDVVLGVLEAMSDCGEKDLRLADRYVDDENLDIGCAAVRLIAAKGLKSAQYRARLAGILRDGKRELVLAALESMRFESDDLTSSEFLRESLSAFSAADESGTNAVTDATFDGIMGAFGETTPAARPATGAVSAVSAAATNVTAVATGRQERVSAATNAVTTDRDIMSMFEGGAAAEPGATNEGSAAVAGARGGETLAGLLKQVEKCMESTGDKDIRFKSALILARFSKTKGVPILQKELSSRTAADREAVAAAIERMPGKDIVPLIKDLLRDPSEEVRVAAAEVCVDKSASTALLEAMLTELSAEGAMLKPFEVPLGRIEKIKESPSAVRIAGKWARRILGENKDVMMRNLAFILLGYCWNKDDVETVRKFIKSEDPWERRAALHTLGKCAPEAFTNEISWVSRDPSEYVRIVIPVVFNMDTVQWVDYFDKTHFRESRYYYSSGHSYYDSYGPRPQIAPEVKDVLLKLTGDESPYVRLESFFCLLSYRQAVDLAQMVKTIESFPDPKTAGDRVASYISSNYEKLGQGFSILVPFVERSKYYDYNLDRIRKHFKLDVERLEEGLAVLGRVAETAPVKASFVEDMALAPREKKQKLVYFTMPGCQGCEKVEKMLRDVKKDFADVDIETHNIRKLESKRLNEALSERFGVPETQRLVAPMIFCGGGFLVKKDITLHGMRQLLARSVWVPLKEWYVVSNEELAKADKSINNRYSSMGMGIVVGFGFLDGINPCAFATIIFLLSYLQITRRTPREILQVGISFIMGVLITYFLLGLGLIEIVLKAQQVLHWFRQALNFILAGFSLVVMVLSIRDGALCLQGRMAEMTLQLPGMLKTGIHDVIRKGSRHAHFVIAAFVVGIVISVLELACTGQVYLPTIGYMLDVGQKSGSAIGYLAIYNIAFIAPLVVVFILACFGLTSERLATFLKKHAAIVKFCTAVLFMVLFIYFVWGDRLPFLQQ